MGCGFVWCISGLAMNARGFQLGGGLSRWMAILLALIALTPSLSAPVFAAPQPLASAWEGTAMSGPAAVIGTIVFPDDLSPGPPARVYARIEDVSRADAPAIELASVTLEGVSVPPPAGTSLTFAIPVPDYDPRMRYSVRVHVDRDGDGQVSVGDLVSTFSHPVLTDGAGTAVTVPVSIV